MFNKTTGKLMLRQFSQYDKSKKSTKLWYIFFFKQVFKFGMKKVEIIF